MPEEYGVEEAPGIRRYARGTMVYGTSKLCSRSASLSLVVLWLAMLVGCMYSSSSAAVQRPSLSAPLSHICDLVFWSLFAFSSSSPPSLLILCSFFYCPSSTHPFHLSHHPCLGELWRHMAIPFVLFPLFGPLPCSTIAHPQRRRNSPAAMLTVRQDLPPPVSGTSLTCGRVGVSPAVFGGVACVVLASH